MERTPPKNPNPENLKGRWDSPNSGLFNDIKYAKFGLFLAEILMYKDYNIKLIPGGETVPML